MEPTRELIDDIYRERVLRARAMSPEEKFLAGPRLFEMACRITMDGIGVSTPTRTRRRSGRSWPTGWPSVNGWSGVGPMNGEEATLAVDRRPRSPRRAVHGRRLLLDQPLRDSPVHQGRGLRRRPRIASSARGLDLLSGPRAETSVIDRQLLLRRPITGMLKLQSKTSSSPSSAGPSSPTAPRTATTPAT